MYEGTILGGVIEKMRADIEEKVAGFIADLIKMVDDYVSTKISMATALSSVLSEEEWWEMENVTQKGFGDVIDTALVEGLKILQMVGIGEGSSSYSSFIDELKSYVLKFNSQLEMIRDMKLMGSNSPKFLEKYNEPEYHRRRTIIVEKLWEHAQKRMNHVRDQQRALQAVVKMKLESGCMIETVSAIISMPMIMLHPVTVDIAKGDKWFEDNWFVIEGETETGDKILYNQCNGAEDTYWCKDFEVSDDKSMRMHDLKSWLKHNDSKGWWNQQTTMSVKYMYCEVMGTMMLHDLTGWLKKQSTSQFKFLYHSIIGGMKVHDLTGWLKDSLFYCL